MPVNYQPPQPFSASLSAAGGAGQALMHDLPTLASAYAHAASMAGQGQAANAQRMQDDRQFQDSLGEKRSEFAANLGQEQSATSERSAQADAEMQNALIRQQQGAQLQSWLSQQDLTQKEKIDLERQKSAVGEVENSQFLSPEDKQDLILQLKTGIDVKTQRMKSALAQSQMDMNQQHADAYKAEAGAKAQAADITARSLAGQVKFVPSQQDLPALQKELVDAGEAPVFNPMDPAGAAQAMAQFQQRVQQEAESRGLGNYYVPGPKGELHPDPFAMERLKQAGAKGKAGAAGGEPAPRDYEKEAESIKKDMAAWEKSQVENNKAPSSEDRKNKLNELIQSHHQIMDALHGASPQAQAKAQSEQARSSVTTTADKLSQSLMQPGFRPDMSDMAKSRVIHLSQETKRLVTEHPDLNKVPLVRKRLKAIADEINQLMPPAQPGAGVPSSVPMQPANVSGQYPGYAAQQGRPVLVDPRLMAQPGQ